MSDTQTPETVIESSIVLDAETYVQRGSMSLDSYAEFAATFKALGGQSCMITFPCHVYATAIPDVPVMRVVGTTEAVAYVESVLV